MTEVEKTPKFLGKTDDILIHLDGEIDDAKKTELRGYFLESTVKNKELEALNKELTKQLKESRNEVDLLTEKCYEARKRNAEILHETSELKHKILTELVCIKSLVELHDDKVKNGDYKT